MNKKNDPDVPGHDMMLKILLIGDSSVGKTCSLINYVNGTFSPSAISTLGIDFKVHNVIKDGRKVKLQIWDTAGQERFRTITQSYYRATQGVIIMYDITDRKSFNNVRYWMNEIMRSDEKIVKILVGNKADLTNHRTIDSSEGAKVAKEYGILFFETSAKTGQNISNVFDALVDASIKYALSQNNDTVHIDPIRRPDDNKKCCT